jgi:elongation factor Ts
MAEISAALVKELRGRTGAGMMDCKKALGETAGDLDAAVDWLRQKGLAAATKRASRVAAEGLIGLATTDNRGAIVEVNSETDFVARNELMQAFVHTVAGLALTTGADAEDLLTMDYPNGGGRVADHLTQLAATVGENVTLRRAATLKVAGGRVANYVHGALAPGLGRIGVLVGLESNGDGDKVVAFGKQLAMHVAAAAPQAVSTEALDPDLVERERAVLRAQAEESGRPAEIVEKMVEGRIRKFYEDVVLAEQIFVIDGESKVSKAIEGVAAEIGAPLKISGFVRFALGEGVDRGETD